MHNVFGTLDAAVSISCLKASLYIAAFLDGHLDEVRTRALHRHLLKCSDCRDTLIGTIHSFLAEGHLPRGMRQASIASLWADLQPAAENVLCTFRLRDILNTTNGTLEVDGVQFRQDELAMIEELQRGLRPSLVTDSSESKRRRREATKPGPLSS